MEAKDKPYKKWGAVIYLLPKFTVQGTRQVQGRQDSGSEEFKQHSLFFMIFPIVVLAPFSLSGDCEDHIHPQGLLKKTGTDAQLEHGPLLFLHHCSG